MSQSIVASDLLSRKDVENETPVLDPSPGEGDDDALILWFLGLTDSERLAFAQDFVDSVRLLRDGLRS
jgi:hypothetical protein